MSQNGAFVTLLTKPSYLAATLVLHYSLVSVKSKYPLVVMATPDLGGDARDSLRKRGIVIRDINSLRPVAGTHTLAAHDNRFNDTWTKLRAFELSEYDRVVLIDSDMMFMRNMDELLDIELAEDGIAAAHACACNPHKYPHYPADWTPKNCAHSSVAHPTGITSPPVITESSPRPYLLLNSGVVVLNPSQELFDSIENFLITSPLVPTFSFPDQDLLAEFFKGRWKVLPWCYNALKTLRTIHQPLWRDEEVRCLHYILSVKPWHSPPGTGGQYEEMNVWWRDTYQKLGEEMKVTDETGWKLADRYVAKAE